MILWQLLFLSSCKVLLKQWKKRETTTDYGYIRIHISYFCTDYVCNVKAFDGIDHSFEMFNHELCLYRKCGQNLMGEQKQ